MLLFYLSLLFACQGIGYFQASLAFQPTPPYDFVCIYHFYLVVFCCAVCLFVCFLFVCLFFCLFVFFFFMEIKLNIEHWTLNIEHCVYAFIIAFNNSIIIWISPKCLFRSKIKQNIIINNLSRKGNLHNTTNIPKWN